MTYADDNWAKLVEKYEPLIGGIYLDVNEKEWTFIGLLHGQDDFYYVMWQEGVDPPYYGGRTRLLTCVGSLAGIGFTRRK